jgi:hypothetical protein
MPAKGEGQMTTLSGEGSSLLIVALHVMQPEVPLIKGQHTR